MRRATIAALVAAAAPIAAAVEAAEPVSVSIVTPPQPDAVQRETTTRLAAELAAAGFIVSIAEADADADPRAAVERAASRSRPAAAMTIVRTERGAAADVWVADHVTHKTLVRRVDTDAGAEASLPAALAIRAVELLRASLLEANPRAAPPRPPPVVPADVPRGAAAPAAPGPPSRALLERVSLEVGITALSGLGDTGSRLVPTVRLAYGATNGLAGRLTMMGPTATDQLGMAEVVYGFDRSWRTLVPTVSFGAGAIHTYNEGSGGPPLRRLRTRAWSVVLGGSAGVAARAGDRAAFLFDVHALLAEPTANAIVGGARAAGQAQLVMAASFGVIAGF